MRVSRQVEKQGKGNTQMLEIKFDTIVLFPKMDQILAPMFSAKSADPLFCGRSVARSEFGSRCDRVTHFKDYSIKPAEPLSPTVDGVFISKLDFEK